MLITQVEGFGAAEITEVVLDILCPKVGHTRTLKLANSASRCSCLVIEANVGCTLGVTVVVAVLCGPYY